MRNITDMSWLMYTMLVLATYRFTHLIVFDKISEFLRKPFLRTETKLNAQGEPVVKKKPTSMFGYLLNCYWCAGIWSALLIGLSYLTVPKLAWPAIFILSMAGAQAVLETFVGVAARSIKAHKEKSDGLP